jgi:hypothetical protein
VQGCVSAVPPGSARYSSITFSSCIGPAVITDRVIYREYLRKGTLIETEEEPV